MRAETEALRVHIRLTMRNRGGRPCILTPKEIGVAMDRGQDARLLRAVGRAWNCRRRLERGDVTTIADFARESGISDRYVSRIIRLAWLSPSALERLVLRREPTVLSIFDLCGLPELPWVEQLERVFDGGPAPSSPDSYGYRRERSRCLNKMLISKQK